jgi:hypothetical protein
MTRQFTLTRSFIDAELVPLSDEERERYLLELDEYVCRLIHEHFGSPYEPRAPEKAQDEPSEQPWVLPDFKLRYGKHGYTVDV